MTMGRTGPLARLSIGHKLPLMTGALLLLLAAALSAAAYVQLRRTLLSVATERLEAVTRQITDLLRASQSQMVQPAYAMSRRPALGSYLAGPGAHRQAPALAALRYDGPQPGQVYAVELRDGAGRSALAAGVGAARVARLATAGLLPRPAASDSGAVGPFLGVGDSIIYPVVAPVPGPQGGYLVHWRRLTGSARSREQLTRLIGSAARLYVGNRDGTLWTDLVGVAPSVPAPASRLAELVASGRADLVGGDLASAAGVPGAPWVVLVEFPRALILAPAGPFLRQLALITLASLVLGLGGTWALSRRITAPLIRLTEASDAMAAGDYSRRVPVDRADELGRLGASFGAMAAQVEASRHRLEEKVQDRTRELREAQDALVRREKLAMLGQLASGVGHELRNPLGVMTNAIYYLEAVQGSAPANVREYLQILRQQVALSEKIVSDLLDFARVKPPQHQEVALGSLVDKQVERLGAPEKVRVRVDIPPGLPAARVDPVQTGQVVFNLLVNAVQAMGEAGGELVLRGAPDGGGRITLEVADTGPGVAPELREKIFEPLFTTKARGIGLGLAVSRQLARANAGDLTLAPGAGPGARFVLWLPAA